MIKIKPSHKGMLHADLNIPQGQKIPVKTMRSKMKSASPAEKKRLVFAMNARKFNHKRG